jgi:hypothetical protein
VIVHWIILHILKFYKQAKEINKDERESEREREKSIKCELGLTLIGKVEI